METDGAQSSPGKDPVKSISIRVPEIPTITFANDVLCSVCPQPGRFRCSACKQRRTGKQNSFPTIHQVLKETSHMRLFNSPRQLTHSSSRECQKLDRPTHKIFCKSFNSFTAGDRPSPLHIRGIFFPEDKEKPEWTWILMNEDHTAISVPHLYNGLPTEGLPLDVTTAYFRTRKSRDPQHWLTCLFRDQLSRGENASSINKSLLGLGPPGHLATYWGPLLVVSNMPVQACPTDDATLVAHFQDLKMQDLWTIISFLTYSNIRNPCVVNVPRAPIKSIPGIMINCVGDRARWHPDKDPNSDAAIYEAVAVPNEVPYSKQCNWPSILAFMLGLPWICRIVLNSADLWATDPNGWPSIVDRALIANPELGHLDALLFENSPEVLGAPSAGNTSPLTMKRGPHYGTVILVHMFGKRIRPEHVKLVNMFAEERGFATITMRESWPLSVGRINLTGFGEYWDRKQRENNVPGMDLRGVPHPYDGTGQWNLTERCVEYVDRHDRFFNQVQQIMSFISRPVEPDPLTGLPLPRGLRIHHDLMEFLEFLGRRAGA